MQVDVVKVFMMTILKYFATQEDYLFEHFEYIARKVIENEN
jgi:hypothetical protein